MSVSSKIVFAAIFFNTVISAAHAQLYYGNGYTIVEGETREAGTDIDVKVFKSINAVSVKEGINQLLSGSGWKLALEENADPAIYRLYRQQYPEYKRTLNPMNLGQALQYIAGSAWDLVIDPVNKLVSFQLKDKYQYRLNICTPNQKVSLCTK